MHGATCFSGASVDKVSFDLSLHSVDVPPPGGPRSRSLALHGAPSPKNWLTGSRTAFKSKGTVSREVKAHRDERSHR